MAVVGAAHPGKRTIVLRGEAQFFAELFGWIIFVAISLTGSLRAIVARRGESVIGGVGCARVRIVEFLARVLDLCGPAGPVSADRRDVEGLETIIDIEAGDRDLIGDIERLIMRVCNARNTVISAYATLPAGLVKYRRCDRQIVGRFPEQGCASAV